VFYVFIDCSLRVLFITAMKVTRTRYMIRHNTGLRMQRETINSAIDWIIGVYTVLQAVINIR